MLREALAVTSQHDGWARLLKTFDVLAKEQCLIIYHCLPLRKTRTAQVAGKLCRMQRIGNTSFSDKGFVKADYILPTERYRASFLSQQEVQALLQYHHEPRPRNRRYISLCLRITNGVRYKHISK
jgi:hypothetical protein